MDNVEIINRYLDYIELERNLSINTVKTYRTQLYSIKLSKLLQEMKQDDIRDILNTISKDRSVKARNYILICFKNLFEYMKDILHIIDKNPCLGICASKTESKERKSLSLNQIKIMFESIDKSNMRDRTLFRFMVQTGLRVSEITNLKTEDVDLTEDFIHVIGKGNKERFVPIVKSLKQYLIDYVKWRLDNHAETDYFFVDIRNYKKGICRNEINILLNKLSDETGIPKDCISPHVLRHTFATLSLCKGVDLYVLSNVMGHSSIKTTEIYAKSNKYRNKQIMENIDIFS